jgi:hypothetical protein
MDSKIKQIENVKITAYKRFEAKKEDVHEN